MTQPAQVAVPQYRAGSLPDAQSLLDHIIVSVGVADGSRTLLRSDGVNWVPVGSLNDLSSQAMAEAGVDNSTVMTPLRVWQAIAAYFAGSGANTYVDAGYVEDGYVT